MHKIKEQIIDEITKMAPKLTRRDIEDLLTFDQATLQEILTDYKKSKVLNKATVTSLVKFLNELKPFLDLVFGIARVF